MRAFVELTRVKVSEVDEAALAAAAAKEEALRLEQAKSSAKTKVATPPKLSKEDEAALLHTSQLQALVRRSKASALLAYITNNKLSPDFVFQPTNAHVNHHSSTPLHLAASVNAGPVILSLLIKANADPTIPNGDGKPAFDLAGDRSTRDSFRVARSELGEGRWDWTKAHVPPALSKTEFERRGQNEKAEEEKAEKERRKAEEERLRKEGPALKTDNQRKPGRTLAPVEKTAQERREEEARGMSDEMRMRLERERRARAAEARFGRVAGGAGR